MGESRKWLRKVVSFLNQWHGPASVSQCTLHSNHYLVTPTVISPCFNRSNHFPIITLWLVYLLFYIHLLVLGQFLTARQVLSLNLTYETHWILINLFLLELHTFICFTNGWHASWCWMCKKKTVPSKRRVIWFVKCGSDWFNKEVLFLFVYKQQWNSS